MIDERRAGAQRLFADDFTRLVLGADEQDAAFVRGKLAYKFHRLLVHDQGLLEVDDMDLVAMTENERRHLRIPVTGLVSEMDARFEHLTHGDRH
jgi:hypothetical protein